MAINLTQEEVIEFDDALADIYCFCKGINATQSDNKFDLLLEAVAKIEPLRSKIKKLLK